MSKLLSSRQKRNRRRARRARRTARETRRAMRLIEQGIGDQADAADAEDQAYVVFMHPSIATDLAHFDGGAFVDEVSTLVRVPK